MRGRIWIVSAVMVILTTLPYIVGAVSAPPGTMFSGVIVDPIDYNSHLAKMQQGARGEWLYQLLFTAEAHSPALLQTFYVALGHLGTNFNLTYQLARIICVMLMVWALWAFLRHYLAENAAWWALLLCLFSGGIGYILFILAPAMTAQTSPIEFWLLDAYTFFAAFVSPHFAAGIALLAVAFLTLDQWTSGDPRRYRLLILFLTTLAIGMIQPFDLLLVDAVLVIVTLWRVRNKRIAPVNALTGLILIGVAHAAIVGYDWIVLYHFPVWQSFTEQNITLSPPPIYYLLGYAPTLFTAIGGIILIIRRREGRWLVPVLWLIGVAALVYAPLLTQRRFLMGVQAPLSALTVCWIVNAARSRRWMRRRSRLPAYSALLLASLSTIMLLIWLLAQTRDGNNHDLYVPDSVRLAWNWIDTGTSPQSVILAAFTDGNNLVGRTGRRTVLGHWIETADYWHKKDEVQRFFATDTSDDWRQDFLKSQNVSYLWYSAEEQQLGGWNPAQVAYLRSVYSQPGVTIYSIESK